MPSLRQEPAELDIYMTRGDDLTFRWRMLDDPDVPNVYRDFSTYTGLAQVRTSPDASTVLATLSVTDYGASAADRGVEVTITDTQSADFPERAHYDVEMTDGSGLKRTYLTGYLYTGRDVSR